MTAMTNHTVVITGATAGIGRVVCERLAEMGASLALVVRNRAKANVLAEDLHRRGAPRVTVHVADLSHVAAVRQLAAELAALPRIDVLLNNAGAIFNRREVTDEGFERTFALNHLAYFVLTNLLLSRLKSSAPARVVCVASEAHRGATLDFADLQTSRSYSGWLAYKRSKLCNILFTRALARRLEGTRVTANALHPGFVASEFGNNNGGFFGVGLGIAKRFMAIAPAEGAKTPVYLASAPEVAELSALYFDKCAVREPSAAAQDDQSAEALWRETAQLTGVG
jgi:NAD(P)-dependent dehydrogenase (short-subunit alcohol dehydrogenase family)